MAAASLVLRRVFASPPVVDGRLVRVVPGGRVFLLGGFSESHALDLSPLRVHVASPSPPREVSAPVTLASGCPLEFTPVVGISGSAPPQSGGLACARLGRASIVVFGGYGHAGNTNQAHVLDTESCTWRELRPRASEVPLPRAGHTLTALARGEGAGGGEGVRSTFVLFGGYGSSALNDVVLLEVGAVDVEGRSDAEAPLPCTWVYPKVYGTPPSARCAHSAVATPDGTGIVIFGGFGNGGADGSTFLLEVTTEAASSLSAAEGQPCVIWSRVDTIVPQGVTLARSGHTAVCAGDLMLVCGGTRGTVENAAAYGDKAVVMGEALALDLGPLEAKGRVQSQGDVAAPLAWRHVEVTTSGGQIAPDGTGSPAPFLREDGAATILARYNHGAELLPERDTALISETASGEGVDGGGAQQQEAASSLSLHAQDAGEPDGRTRRLCTYSMLLVGGNDSVNAAIHTSASLSVNVVSAAISS
mmetsp:Transcript_25152/g.68170  ORF Transcript_25152/g.68170 Transcript_25152/m.68170 type:complete len:475 (-) Transcript_25152:211-1635(-)